MRKATYMFGRKISTFTLNSVDIQNLVEQARTHAHEMAKVPLSEILEILDRVSRFWKDPSPAVRKSISALPGLVGFSREMVAAGISAVSGICARENLLKRLTGEFNDPQILDEWVERRELGFDIKAVPRAPIVHISSGNVFVGAVDSLVSGIITKNANILKMSGADPLFPVLFMESLKKADPENRVWPHQAVVSWKGGDDTIEKELLSTEFTVVFWGGGEALKSVRSKIGMNTRLIENGPRYSFAIIDKESSTGKALNDSVRGLALDVARWDQQACSSPHVVYCLEIDDSTIIVLMQKIAIELDVLSRELPLGRLSFDEKVEIRKVREIAQMAQATGTGALVSSPCRRGIPAPTKSKPEDTFLFSLIFEKDPVFKISCLNRTLFFKKAGSVDQLIGLVKPMAEYLQTVGLNVSPNSAGEIQKKLLRIGVKRLTKWGGMSEGHDGAPHEGSFMLTRLVDFVSREQLPHPVFDHLPPGRTPGGRISSSPSTRVQRVGEGARRAGPPEVRHRGAGGPPPPPCEMGEGERSVEDRIADLLENLHGSNYYRRFLNKKKPDLPVWDRFYSLPLLDRDTFYRNSPPVSNDIFTRPSTDAYVYASGGTSGKAKYVLYGNDEYIKATDILSFIYETAGITKDDIVGNIFLAGNLWTSFNVACRALENLGCLNLPIGGATDFSNIIQYLQDFHATAIVGLPSIIVKLAEEVKARGISLRIPKILYGGEHMRPQTREFLKSALGCKWVRSAGYACVDTGPIGFQCEHLEGTLHHVLDKYQFVEIIKPEKGSSQAVYGKKEFSGAGEIVCTNLDRMLMPVVRYRTGDMGTWVKKINCPCGYKGRTFELLGRCDDLMVIGGINLMPSDISAGLAFLPVSPNFQVIARIRGKKDCLLLRLEAGKPLERKKVLEALEKGCYKLLETLKDGWLELELEWFPPGGLPRNQRTGKLKVMIDERG